MKHRTDATSHMSRSLFLAVVLAAAPAWAATTADHGVATGKRIATGGAFSCAIDDAGLVRCWGQNWNGELGDGTQTSRNVPTIVRGIDEPAIAIAAGDYHACVLTQSGAVKCWGSNASGRLGDGTTNDSAVPVDAVGLSEGVVKISAGGSHTCAITDTGALMCWGRNGSGQLGDFTTTDRHTPTQTPWTSVLSVATGGNHTCIATLPGWAVCWGRGYRGQLGDGKGTDAPNYPVNVSGISGATELTAGRDFSCARLVDGAVKCWGANEYGQLGDSTNTDRLTPVDVGSLESGVTMVDAGYYHVCAIQQGATKCWGYNNTGRLGNGTRINSTVPVAVTGLSTGVQQVDAGRSQSCAWLGDNEFSCWGNNSYGQIGIGLTGIRTRPVDVVGLGTETSSIGGSYTHTCAIQDGATLCWGDNRYGQLGDGSYDGRHTPVPVSGLATNSASLTVSGYHACVLTVDGDAKCWGNNDRGQLGDGTVVDRNSPVDVVGLGASVRQIATAPDHSCAVTATGGVKCWGRNFFGELGDGTTDDRIVPGDVAGLTSGVAAVSVASSHSCALLEAGNVKCWGSVPSSSDMRAVFLTPIDMPGLESNVTAITSGGGQDCAVIDGIRLNCFGYNSTGALGDGTTNDSPMNPVQVVGLDTGIASASAGGGLSCAVDSAGAAKCWGLNDTGQLGDGTEAFQREFPANVYGLGTGMASIAAGSYATCAVSTAGAAKCWGDNLYGQLGNGETASVLIPADVLIDEELFRAGFE